MIYHWWGSVSIIGDIPQHWRYEPESAKEPRRSKHKAISSRARCRLQRANTNKRGNLLNGHCLQCATMTQSQRILNALFWLAVSNPLTPCSSHLPCTSYMEARAVLTWTTAGQSHAKIALSPLFLHASTPSESMGESTRLKAQVAFSACMEEQI